MSENSSTPPAFVCRCEEVTAEEVLRALADGALTINDVKRRTRAGMGICQGAYCLEQIASIVAAGVGCPIWEVAPMTCRPPVRIVSLDALARLAGADSGPQR